MVLIQDHCSKEIRSRILNCKDAAEAWEELKSTYGPQLSRPPDMLGEFVSYVPQAGMRVSDMAEDLAKLQHDIAEVCREERPSDMMKTAVLLRAADDVVRAAGDKGWAVLWAMRGREFLEVLRALVTLEEEVTKRKRVEEGNRGGRKRGRRRQ